jgi:hypothetical protein
MPHAIIELLPEDESPFWEIRCDVESAEQFKAKLIQAHEALGHNVRIYADSARGQGTTRSIVIPKRRLGRAALEDCISKAITLAAGTARMS